MRTKTPQRPERKGCGRWARSALLSPCKSGPQATMGPVEGYGSVFGVCDNYDDVIARARSFNP